MHFTHPLMSVVTYVHPAMYANDQMLTPEPNWYTSAHKLSIYGCWNVILGSQPHCLHAHMATYIDSWLFITVAGTASTLVEVSKLDWSKDIEGYLSTHTGVDCIIAIGKISGV